MRSYPATFPKALWRSYSWHTNMGLVQAQGAGFIEQRQRYFNMPTQCTLTFAVSLDALPRWQQWIEHYALEWFEMPQTSWINDPAEVCEVKALRLIGELSVSPLTDKVMLVTCQGEMADALS